MRPRSGRVNTCSKKGTVGLHGLGGETLVADRGQWEAMVWEILVADRGQCEAMVCKKLVADRGQCEAVVWELLIEEGEQW